MSQDSKPEDITLIKKMLEALLRNQNNIHWIGGYAPGKTSTGDPYIVLYAINPKLEHKICRVYAQDFPKLPAFIDRAIPAGVGNGNPTRQEAIKAGIYKACPNFKIVTYNGKDTQMGPERRFSDVLVVSKESNHAPA